VRLIIPLVVAAVGCTSDPASTGDTDRNTGWTLPEAGVIQLTTRDDVTLVADYHPVDAEGAPAVILLHMIPPSNTRADWPLDFRTALHDQGLTVISVDRRGAGDSGGVASEAYTGTNGKFDVEACAKRLQDDGYGSIAIIAASNGTTSMIDYAAWAGGEGLPEPVGLAFMSGGAYTTAQTPMSSVPKVPALFVYPPEEAAWPQAQASLDPGSWRFEEYAGGAHGTRMFTTSVDAEVRADLLEWIGGVFE